MLKDLRLENLAKMLKDKYITLLHNIIVQSHFLLTMVVVDEGNKGSVVDNGEGNIVAGAEVGQAPK